MKSNAIYFLVDNATKRKFKKAAEKEGKTMTDILKECILEKINADQKRV